MMDQRELDRAIDTAAAGLIIHEPSRTLSYKVMSRVRQGDACAPHRFVRVTAAAGVVLGVATAVVLMYRAPQANPPLPPARPFVLGQLPKAVEPTLTPIINAQPAPRLRTEWITTEIQ